MTRETQQRKCDSGHRRGFWRNKGGNIALITAFVMIPLTFALGMAFDFTLSQTRKDQLDGIADAAALGTVTPTEMALPCPTAAAQAVTLFNGQEATVAGVTGLSVATPGCPDVTSGTTVTRAITVNYTAQSQNVFASLLGMPTLPIHGSSTATSSTAPNINFYLLLDTSPSMEIAATTTGITQLEGLTIAQQTDSTPQGCAFGCHETAPSGCSGTGKNQVCWNDVPGNPANTDNYSLAESNNISLRIDLVREATQNLMTSAASTETADHATYKAAINTFDVSTNVIQTLTSNLSTAGSQAANITPLLVYRNNYLTSGNDNDDEDTYIDAALADVNTTSSNIYMPTPGGGTNNPQDTPQEVLFIVTDGMNDELVGSGGNCGSSTRACVPIDVTGSLCTAIKNRGIRIAVLYTVYYPLDTDPAGGQTWYDLYIDPTTAPPLPNISPDAQACASPGLFYAVSTNGDISAALQTLFQEAVATARLLH